MRRNVKELRSQRQTLGAPDFATWLIKHYGQVLFDHLHGRANLTRDDLEYVVVKTSTMKDTRLAECIATLIGWGDEERAEIETFCAIAIEVMRHTPPSRLRQAAATVEAKALAAGAQKV